MPKTLLPMLAPYATQVLSALTNAKVFHILPVSKLGTDNPHVLPREVYIEDVDEMAEGDTRTAPLESEVDPPVPGLNSMGKDAVTRKVPKKKGRPSKRETVKRASDAVAVLDRWLERTDPMGQVVGRDEAVPSRAGGQAPLAHGRSVSNVNYRAHK